MTQTIDTDSSAGTPGLAPGELAASVALETVVEIIDAAHAADVAVVGLGYVGLPTALAFACTGARVLGLDTSSRRRSAIADADVDLLPRDRERLLGLRGDRRFTVVDHSGPLASAAAVLICVPTPVDEHLSPDLGALRSACHTVAQHAVPGQLIVLTSTSYVGTTRELLVDQLVERGLLPGRDVFVAFSPERIDPANASFPVERTPRVVGGVTAECTRRAAALLRRVSPYVHEVSSPETAEMTKLHENTFRAVNIAYANEIADVCATLGLDVGEVVAAAATKPYGFMTFRPGPGVGGHCIPCDPHYLLWQLRADRVQAPVVDAAMRAIAGRPGQVADRAREMLGQHGRPVSGARVLVVGMSYKPGVADVRESPAIEIAERLVRAGAQVSYLDPFVCGVVVGGEHLPRVLEPGAASWDLVLVHTVHPGTDLEWLERASLVLDASYTLGQDRAAS